MNDEVANKSAERRKLRRIVRTGHGNSTGNNEGGNNGGNTGTNSASATSDRNLHDNHNIAGDGNEVVNATNGDTITFDQPGRKSKSNRGDGSGRSSSTSRRTTGTGGNGTESSSSNSDAPAGNDGKPQRVNRKQRTNKETQSAVHVSDKKQDEDELTELIIALADGAANATTYDGFRISDPEARTVTRPASRILARHGNVAETIRAIADPAALLIAAVSLIVPRIMGFLMYRQLLAQQGAYPHPGREANEARANNDNVIRHERFNVDQSFASQFAEG